VAGAGKLLIENRVLAGLSRRDYRQLLPFLEPVKLDFGQVLYESQERMRYVYFPNDCFVSMLTGVDGDRSAEVGLIGSEGMIGLPVALGIAVSPFRAVVQGGGTAMRMKIADFRREFRQRASLKRELFLFTHLLMIQIAQTAACNRFHRLSQRMARWILMTSDRVKSNEFRIKQEFLALMLGARRVGISVAASGLRDVKLLDYRRGSFTILNHAGLEAAACGCYKIVKDVYARAQGRRDLPHQR
jgi:CRP-like cAMP-binding protein